jgi:branched-chain amino acid transport system substrate-binding protein
MKRKLNLVILSLLTVSMLFSLAPDITKAQRSDTIKIGALGPLAIPTGVDMENGVKLAIKEINDGDGVDVGGTPHDFDLYVETTSGSDGLPDPTTGVTNLNVLVAEGVAAIIGGFRTEVVVGLQLSPAGINSSHVPFLGVGSTAPIITDYYYRVGPVNGTQLAVQTMAFYVTALGPLMGVQNVTIVREDAAWTEAVSAAIAATLPGLGFTVDTSLSAIPEGATGAEVATAMNSLTTDDVTDAILPLFSAPVGKAVTEQWAALGLNEKMYLAGINVAAQDSNYHVDTDGAATGEITLAFATPDINPTSKTKDFRDAYVAEYNEQPTYTAMGAYDSVYIVKEAIERADAITPAAIHAELPNTDYIGVTARIKFTAESSAAQVASPAVPATLKGFTNATAHDLYTPSTIGVLGTPYAQAVMGQWQETDELKAVWAGTATGFIAINAPSYAPDDTDEGLLLGFEILQTLFVTTMIVSVYKIGKRRRKD